MASSKIGRLSNAISALDAVLPRVGPVDLARITYVELVINVAMGEGYTKEFNERVSAFVRELGGKIRDDVLDEMEMALKKERGAV